jgi:short-subunit dehydrogenase
LGEQFARLFARDGRTVVLVARDEGRLAQLATELEQTHHVAAHVLAGDLRDPATPQRLFDAVTARALTVDVLVNNAGFGSNGPFVDLALVNEAAMVEVNCTALLKLTHLFARSMVERRSGRILNIASTAGFQPGPYMATYYATKAFVVSFSEALAYELRGQGVQVTCYCPGATATDFARRSGNASSKLFQSPAIASAADVAADAYEALLQGDSLAVHGVVNWLAMQALRVGPRAWVRAITAALNQP